MKRAEEINQEMDHWLKVYMGKSDQTTPATPTTPEAIKGETA